MDSNWFQLLAMVVSIISVVIGYVFTKKLEMSREKRKYKAELFLKYISISNRIDNNSKNTKYDIEYSTTVEKLCLYANEDVLTLIAQFHEKFDNKFMGTDEGKELYSEIIIAMRKDIGLKSKKINVEKMINILELNS